MSGISSETTSDLIIATVRTTTPRRIVWLCSVVVIAGAFGIIPFIGSDYWLNAILIPFLIMSLAGLGLNITMGFSGQASLGSGAFMAVGTYATYNLLLRVTELPLYASLMAGALITGLVGLIVALPSLRIKGFYLIATTLAAQFFIEWMFNQYGWFSNYSSSISAPRLSLFGIDLDTPPKRYLFVLCIVSVVFLIAWRLVRSQTGRNWMAVRDMEMAAAVVGIPVASAKLSGFFVGALICGIAGALWSFVYLGSIDANTFNLERSFQVMFIVIIGGLGSLVGNFLGAAFIVLLPILIDHWANALIGGSVDAGQLQNFQKILLGALIVWILIKEPHGLASLFGRLLNGRS